MQRYFIDSKQIDYPYIKIIDNDYHHIKTVMRMKKGDKVYACSNNTSYLCVIDDITDTDVVLLIQTELNEQTELPVEVTICQGLVRKEKMEETVDYITELGAYAYMPVIMERSIVKVNNDKRERKNERLQKIAKEAAEQSHRKQVLKVHDIYKWKDMLEESKNYDLCLFAYENADKDALYKDLITKDGIHSILVVIGPEGGISLKEVESLLSYNFIPITLGKRILRTQVAPLYVMSTIGFMLEQ